MSRLKRKKQQDKRIAQKKIEPIEQIEDQDGKKRRKRQIEPLPNQYKILVYSFFGIVLIGVIVLIVVLTLKERGSGIPEYFEEYPHITTNHYKVLTNYGGYFDENDLSDDEKEVYDEIAENLKSKIFIFLYNPFDEEWNKEMENFIISKLEQNNKDYTLLVMNYSKNVEIEELVFGITDLENFALISIENNKLDDTIYRTVTSIKYELS